MEATNVTLRLDKDLKEQADALYKELGLTFTAAVNLFLRKSVRTQSIPFDVDLSTGGRGREAYSAAFERLLSSENAQQVIGSIHAGGNIDYGMSISDEDISRILQERRERSERRVPPMDGTR